MNQKATPVLLSLKHINKYFKKGGYLFKAVNDATFDVNQGDFFGVIGESGSGKSTIGKIIIRLLTSDSGVITFDGNLISQLKISKKMTSWLAKNMQMVFQDPMGSLNPKKNIINIISEPLRINKTINDEANQIIKDHITINPYFQYTYKQKDFELSKVFDDHYFQSMIEIFKKGIEDINNYEYNPNLTLDENKFEFISILLNVDDCAKKVNYALYKYSKDIRNIYLDCKKIHDNKQNHPLEINLFEIKSKLEHAKKLLSHSEEYYTIKDKIKKLSLELKQHKINSSEKFIDQNQKYVNGLLDAIKLEIETLKQRLSICTTFIYSLYLIASIKAKTYLSELIRILPKLDMVNIQDLQDIIGKIDHIVDTKSAIIEQKINDLKLLSNEKDNIIEQMVINDEINIVEKNILKGFDLLENNLQSDVKLDQILDKLKTNQYFNDLLNKIMNLSSEINKDIEDFKIDISEVDRIVQVDQYPSYQQRLIDADYSKQLESAIASCKIYLSQIRHEKKSSSEEYKLNFVKYQDLLLEYEKASQACNEHYENDINIFNQEMAPKIQAHKTILKNYEKELAALKRDFKHLVKNKLNKIHHQIKNLKIHDKDGFNSFKNDALIRLRTIDALTFEFETILDEVTLYRGLRSLNPLLVKLKKPQLVKTLTRFKVYKALNAVGLKNEHAYRYPHEFSGGQRQRIVIARALISNPKLIIADEPISALDVSIQAQVINIMKELAEKNGITFVFIAHDLSMVNYACNRMIIMHNGRILEKGDTNEIFENPIHPYTLSLLKASPELSKIHINLAQNTNNYGYDANHIDDINSKFYSISDTKEHFVYATEEQIKLWTKMKNHSA